MCTICNTKSLKYNFLKSFLLIKATKENKYDIKDYNMKDGQFGIVYNNNPIIIFDLEIVPKPKDICSMACKYSEHNCVHNQYLNGILKFKNSFKFPLTNLTSLLIKELEKNFNLDFSKNCNSFNSIKIESYLYDLICRTLNLSLFT